MSRYGETGKNWPLSAASSVNTHTPNIIMVHDRLPQQRRRQQAPTCMQTIFRTPPCTCVRTELGERKIEIGDIMPDFGVLRGHLRTNRSQLPPPRGVETHPSQEQERQIEAQEDRLDVMFPDNLNRIKSTPRAPSQDFL